MKEIAPAETLEALSPEYNSGRLGNIALRNLAKLDHIDLGIDDLDDLFQN